MRLKVSVKGKSVVVERGETKVEGGVVWVVKVILLLKMQETLFASHHLTPNQRPLCGVNRLLSNAEAEADDVWVNGYCHLTVVRYWVRCS